MSRLPDPTAVRVNRRHYVNVESATVRNSRLSYRALGLLVYLLDQKEGWQVRSDQLSKGEGREGRGAVRTALRELAVAGHYRLERRKLRSGKCVMGTALSEYPIEQWVRDHEIFSTVSDPAVPVVEQADGTFLVEYPDGTLGSDGFEPDPDADEEAPADPAPEDGESEDVEAPAEETLAAPEKPATRPTRVRRTPAQKAADDSEKAAAKQQKDEEKAALDAAAEEVAKWWWDDAEKHLGKYAGKTNGYIAMRGQVRKALAVGYTKQQCAKALRETRQHLPSAQQWQRALGIVTNHIAPTRPTGRVPYSDAASWGSLGDSPATTSGDTPATNDTDDATFGVVTRTTGV